MNLRKEKRYFQNNLYQILLGTKNKSQIRIDYFPEWTFCELSIKFQ